jgi:hypothetical protein
MGFGGQQAQAPTLDVGQSTALPKEIISLLKREAGPVTQVLGSASRQQDVANRLFGLRSLTNPGEALGRQLERETRPLLASAQKELKPYLGAKPRTDRKTGETFYMVGKQRLSADDFEARKSSLESSVDQYNRDLSQARNYDPIAELTGAFKDEYGMRDQLLGNMRQSIGSTAEYSRFQDALGRGVQAQQADMERMQAQQTDESSLGRSLMDEAARKMAQGGQLSPEAQREAVQSARQGFASRGMATGNAALGAELLNRDRFARQREFENLGFAQGVEANDLARRTQNTLLRQQAGMQNAQAFNNLSQFNTLQRDATNRANMGFLGQSAALSDAERTRQLMTQQDMYNFSMSTDPRMMLAGMGSPYANMASPAASSLTSMIGMAQPQYSGGQFSSGGGAGAAMGAGGALLGAGAGALLAAPTGGMSIPMGMALGGSLGGAGGNFAGSFFR